MTLFERSLEAYLADLTGSVTPAWARPDAPGVVVVTLDDVRVDSVAWRPGPSLASHLSAVVVGITRGSLASRPASDLPVDVVVDSDDALDAVVAQVHHHPVASTSLAQVLRNSEQRSLDEALLLESAVYSTLQAGPEFEAWRSRRAVRHRAATQEPPVLTERDGAVLRVTSHRPQVRNALDRAMRDGLIEALEWALLDDTIERIEWSGAGPGFCAGGDLDEFGSFTDPASAHLIRTDRSVGRLLHRLRDRVTVHLHGACFGSGIELPAFVDTVCGDDVVIGLPEVALGLIPGAGGTWSLPRRIGRHRTAWLALTGHRIDRTTALSWGLIDTTPDHTVSS